MPGPGYYAFKLAFELSPILMVNGLAKNIPGGTLPIVAITQALDFFTSLISGSENIELDAFFARFQPLPGSTLVDYQVGTYPFANQTIAANALIQQPLQLSMLMRCPARDFLGYGTKLITMTALQEAMTQHASLGGTYTVLTPSLFYTNGLLTAMRDVSDAQSKQAQNAYQLDFTFPLLTLEAAQEAQNSLMSKITNGTQISGQPAWSGLASSTSFAGGLT